MGQQYSQQSDETWSTEHKPKMNPETKKELSTWQKTIKDDVYICNVNLPGSHNSLSRFGGYMKIIPAQTHSWKVEDQLSAGIRAFDMRAKLDGDEFKAYHEDVNQKLLLKDALAEVYKFLDANPTEFCVANLQYEEYDKKNHDADFLKGFNSIVDDKTKAKYWCIQEEVPQVKDVRGKIFLLTKHKGLGAHSWRKTKQQNKWGAKLNDKKRLAKEFAEISIEQVNLQSGPQAPDDLRFYINFISAATCSKWPLSYAKEMNPFYLDNLNGKGIVFMDFPNIKIIKHIMKVNKELNCALSDVEKQSQAQSERSSERQFKEQQQPVKV